MNQALERHEPNDETSEDMIIQSRLKFLMFLVELAAKDPEWSEELKEKAVQFGEMLK